MKPRQTILLACLFVCLAAVMTGCVDSSDRKRRHWDNQLQLGCRAQNEMILLNIVRAYKRYPCISPPYMI